MSEYYILSTKYNIQERKLSSGKVYDAVFYVIDKNTLERKQKRISGYTTKTAVREAHDKYIVESCEIIKSNLLVKAKKDKTALTVPDLLKVYISAIQNQNKGSTVYEKTKIYERIIAPYFTDKKLTDLTKPFLSEWQDNVWAMKNPKTNDFYSYKYLLKIRTCLCSFLTWCNERYEVPNLLLQIKIPKRRTPKKEMQFWTREEFEKFIAVVDNPTYHCLFTMLFFTGRRKGEILALSPDDIFPDSIRFNKSLTRKTLSDKTYEITSTKTEKVGLTPICNTLKQEIKTYTKTIGGGQFFFGGDKPLAENTVTRTFDRYISLANIKRIRIHDLRHSFVSMLIHLNASVWAVADLIGDTTDQILKTYGHLYIQDKLNLITKLN